MPTVRHDAKHPGNNLGQNNHSPWHCVVQWETLISHGESLRWRHAILGCYEGHYGGHLTWNWGGSRQLSVESDPKLRPEKQ